MLILRLMQEHVVEQLDKVLALADSCHEGEAVNAVRKARQILSRDGLSFGDLARTAANRSRFTLPISLFSNQQVHQEAQIARLQQQVYDLQNEVENQQTQIEFWRRRAADLEQQLNLSLSDVQRWRQMARETIEKLWDIGQTFRNEEFDAQTEAPAPQQILTKAE